VTIYRSNLSGNSKMTMTENIESIFFQLGNSLDFCCDT
jgi:hypothetical protein